MGDPRRKTKAPAAEERRGQQGARVGTGADDQSTTREPPELDLSALVDDERDAADDAIPDDVPRRDPVTRTGPPPRYGDGPGCQPGAANVPPHGFCRDTDHTSTAADQLALEFDGTTFDRDIDGPRLTPHLHRCERFMSDGQEHTLAEVARAIGCSEAAASARIRDLRKPRFGGHVVERRRVSGGLWVYRLVRSS